MKAKQFILTSVFWLFLAGVFYIGLIDTIERAQSSDIFGSFGLNFGYQFATAIIPAVVAWLILEGIPAIRNLGPSSKMVMFFAFMFGCLFLKRFWLNDYVRELVGSGL